MWSRNMLCANLTEQALRTCLDLPGSELVLLWLTVAVGHMTDIQPSSVVCERPEVLVVTAKQSTAFGLTEGGRGSCAIFNL